MIIVLEDSIEKLDEICSNEAEVLLSELVRASLNRHHIIIISRDICKWSLEKISLSGVHKAQITYLKENYSQLASLKEKATSILSVEIGNDSPIKSEDNNFTIGHKKLIAGDFLRPSALLVENSPNDSDIIELVFNGHRKKCGPLCFNMESLHGGGSTIKSYFSQIIDDKRIVACVVDSDLLSPFGSESSTVKNLRKESESVQYIGGLFVIEGREIENVIPYSIIRDLKLFPEFSDNHLVNSTVNFDNPTTKGDCPWLYFDIKEGIDFHKLCKESCSAESKQWVLEKYKNCIEVPENFSIQGFGPNFLSVFNSSHRAKMLFSKFMLTQYWRIHFEEFINKFFWLFVCEKRRSAI